MHIVRLLFYSFSLLGICNFALYAHKAPQRHPQPLTKEQEQTLRLHQDEIKARWDKLQSEVEKTVRKKIAQVKKAEKEAKESQEAFQETVEKLMEEQAKFQQWTQQNRRDKQLPYGKTSLREDMFWVTGQDQAEGSQGENPNKENDAMQAMIDALKGKQRPPLNINDNVIHSKKTLNDYHAGSEYEINVKKAVQRVISTVDPNNPQRDTFDSWRTHFPNIILLRGTPGVGKTELIDCAVGEAAQRGITCVEVTGKDLIGRSGESGRNVEELFKQITTEYADHPLLIKMDEIDEFITKRAETYGVNEGQSILLAFTRGLDHLRKKQNVIVLSATNFELDPAFQDRCLMLVMKLPSIQARENYVTKEFQPLVDNGKMAQEELPLIAKMIAAHTERYNYRQIQNLNNHLCNEAALAEPPIEQMTAQWVKTKITRRVTYNPHWLPKIFGAKPYTVEIAPENSQEPRKKEPQQDSGQREG